MNTKLITIKDTFPSSNGGWSLVKYNYEYWNNGNIRVSETIELSFTNEYFFVKKLKWGGLSKEVIYQQDIRSFIDVFSQYPKFQKQPFPTPLEAITGLALEAWAAPVFIKSLKTFSRAVARKNKKEQSLQSGYFNL